MAAGSTYEPIATNTLGTASNTVTFSSISQSYTDLILVCTGTNSNGYDGIDIRVGNGSLDTGTNYSITALYGNGSVAGSFNAANQTSMTNMGITGASIRQTSIYQFINYSNTTTYKNVLGRSNVTDFRISTVIGLWRSTSAINTISLRCDNPGFLFTIGSTFTLWGIKAA